MDKASKPSKAVAKHGLHPSLAASLDTTEYALIADVLGDFTEPFLAIEGGKVSSAATVAHELFSLAPTDKPSQRFCYVAVNGMMMKAFLHPAKFKSSVGYEIGKLANLYTTIAPRGKGMLEKPAEVLKYYQECVNLNGGLTTPFVGTLPHDTKKQGPKVPFGTADGKTASELTVECSSVSQRSIRIISNAAAILAKDYSAMTSAASAGDFVKSLELLFLLKRLPQPSSICWTILCHSARSLDEVLLATKMAGNEPFASEKRVDSLRIALYWLHMYLRLKAGRDIMLYKSDTKLRIQVSAAQASGFVKILDEKAVLDQLDVDAIRNIVNPALTREAQLLAAASVQRTFVPSAQAKAIKPREHDDFMEKAVGNTTYFGGGGAGQSQSPSMRFPPRKLAVRQDPEEAQGTDDESQNDDLYEEEQ